MESEGGRWSSAEKIKNKIITKNIPLSSVVESESEPRSLPELELELLSIILKKFIENIMIAEEVFVNCYNFYFNPVRVEHASINVKKYKYLS